MNLVKSKQRVAADAEVVTPAWMVEAMLDLVKGESERIDARFLKPACGSGNFLVGVAAQSVKYARACSLVCRAAQIQSRLSSACHA